MSYYGQVHGGQAWPESAQPANPYLVVYGQHHCKPICRFAVKGYGRNTLVQEASGWEMLSIEEALSSLKEMADLPSVDSFIFFLQKCKKTKNLAYAKSMHAHVLDKGVEEFRGLGNFLVPMFVDCGSMVGAQQVFDTLVCRNEHSWTSLIQGYVDGGEHHHAFDLFKKMQEDCVQPSVYTLQALLKACARLKDYKTGQEIHAEIVEEGFERDPFVNSTLVDMYAKCSLFEEAHHMFDTLPVRDVVSWNALIAGYAKRGFGDKALSCLGEMQREGVFPNMVTLCSSLKACSTIGVVDRGQEIHADIAKEGFESNPLVANSLVDMYAKCGSLAEAQEVFNNLQVRGVVSWNALIAGYAEQGLAYEALNGLQQMQVEGVSPDAVTYICSLRACASIGATDRGQEIHAEIVHRGFEREPFVGNTLVDLYAKCGLLAEAWETFDKLLVRDVVSWNALLAGYARQGECDFVLRMFERMREDIIQPNGNTFLSVLNVCSHAGLLDLGQTYFEVMSKEYGITPTIKHHNCKIDLLGRAGLLDEAVAMLKNMPFRPDLVTWKTVLGACRKWGDVKLGRQAFDCAVLTWDEKHDAPFILMSNIYADAHMWEEIKQIDAMRAHIGARKGMERSWIEISGHVHTFTGVNTKHPQNKDIHVKLKQICARLEEEGSVPDSDLSAKEYALCGHSSRLSIVCGLVNTPQHMPIRIVKNLQLCHHCHVVVALICRSERRTITCRDASRLHLFQHGKCSCGHS